MRISDWSSDVCSSDLQRPAPVERVWPAGQRHVEQDARHHQAGHEPEDGERSPQPGAAEHYRRQIPRPVMEDRPAALHRLYDLVRQDQQDQESRIGPHPRRKLARSEEHTSELQSLMRISYAVFCLKKKKTNK